MEAAIPLVLRSRAALNTDAEPTSDGLPITALGTTYTMAQEATWIDEGHYAVGRWDGSLSIFSFTESPTTGPIIAKAVNSPAQEGIQMITALPGGRAFITSNDDQSALVWAANQPNWSDLAPVATLSFDSSFGVANSGAVVRVGSTLYFVMGHANGWVTVWTASSATGWVQTATVDVRSGHPVNPWGLTNVRGVAPLASPDPNYGYVVTGSEDGNLTVVRTPDGKIMNAVVYNPAAQRGINSIATNGDLLLVANCAVGPQDSNLWSYGITPGTWEIQNTGRANLAVNPSAPQVFNFDVVWAAPGSSPNFFCSTEEGVLWMGQITQSGGLLMQGSTSIIGGALGSAICCQNGQLTATAYDLHEFQLQPS